MTVLDRITKEETWTTPSSRSGTAPTLAVPASHRPASTGQPSDTSRTAAATLSVGRAKPRNNASNAPDSDLTAVLALAVEHRPVWDTSLHAFVCNADGRRDCPCYRHAVDLIEHACPTGCCWGPADPVPGCCTVAAGHPPRPPAG